MQHLDGIHRQIRETRAGGVLTEGQLGHDCLHDTR